VVPLDSNISAHILILYRVYVTLDIQCPTRNPYLLVQESLAHGPVGADSGRGDGRVCVGVGHCECDVGLLREAERIVNMKYSSPGCSRFWELVVSNASCILGTKPIPSALARASYQKVEAASKDSRATSYGQHPYLTGPSIRHGWKGLGDA
jgi:hypothetical protein